MKLNKLSLKDKKIFHQFLSETRHELSVYALANIYIWKGLFDIRWLVVEDSLCIFFQDKIGCFLYLPPLSKYKDPRVTKKVFKILDKFNKNKDISRIENIEQKDLLFYKGLGYDCRIKSYDYLCLRSDLVKLQGNKFKSKRACFNYFVKHNEFEYLPFSSKYRNSCLKLYNFWKEERKVHNQEPIYQGMLEDSSICLKLLLKHYQDLDVLGRAVKINKEIRAFTFGFRLNSDTFCILYEVADLSNKGLAQFIFRKFCSELKNYKYINIMDDSGLENLKIVKLSYHPVRLIPSYIIKRQN